MFGYRQNKFILGALSAIILSVPSLSGAYAPESVVSTSAAVQSSAVAEAVGKVSAGYFDSVKEEIGRFIAANHKMSEQERTQTIVAGSKELVQKYPEAVPTLLAEVRANFPGHYEAVKGVVTQVDAPGGVASAASLVKEVVPAVTQSTVEVAAAAPAAKRTGSWLDYKMKVDVNGTTKLVVWSPTKWRGGEWWPADVTKASQKAWKVAVFNNKYLSVQQLSADQTASLWGPWAQDSWKTADQDNIFKQMYSNSGGAVKKTMTAFFNRKGWEEKLGVAQDKTIEVARVNVDVTRIEIDKIIRGNDTSVVNRTTPDGVSPQ